MGKKKILIDTFCLLTAPTGIRTYTTELCASIEENANGVNDYIIYPSLNRVQSLKIFRRNDTFLRKAGYHLSYFIWKQMFLPLVLLVKRVDVLISPDFVVPVISSVSLKLAVIHDAFFWDMPQHYNRLWRDYYIKMIRAGLTSKAKVVTTSIYSKSSLSKHLKNADISVVYQCSKKLPECSESIEGLYPRLDPKKYILHVGTFDKRKNLPYLVRVFSHFIQTIEDDEIKLVLAGLPGSSPALNDFQNVQSLVEELKLQERVLFLGFVPDKQLKCLYQEALFYVFPSYDEGFGIPIIESMQCGLPVIVSNKGSLPEIGAEAVLVFDTEKKGDLKEKMYRLYENQSLRVELAARGKQRASVFSRVNFLHGFERLI